MNKEKIRIKFANTATLQVIYGGIDYRQYCTLYDYLDELRQAAIWSKE
jgi:hypothetical protein